jgi:hypothetical protein
MLVQPKNYVRQYLGIAIVLEGRHELDSTTNGQLFLRGLSEKARRHVIVKTDWNRSKPAAWHCKNIIEEALEYMSTEENIEACNKLEECAQQICLGY